MVLAGLELVLCHACGFARGLDDFQAEVAAENIVDSRSSRSPAARRQTRQGEKAWRRLAYCFTVLPLQFRLRGCSVEVPKELECDRRTCNHRLVSWF